MTDLFEAPLRHFMDTLASGSSTPGGGSVAALTGAMAAGLVTMVCDLTIGKKQYVAVEAKVRQIRAQAEALRRELEGLAEEDIAVFGSVSAAYKLSKQTEADQEERRAAIQRALKLATDAPLRTAKAARALLPLCLALAEHGNRTAISDILAGALLIRAAVPAALLNVESNLALIDDETFAGDARAAADTLLPGLDAEVDRVLAVGRERLS